MLTILLVALSGQAAASPSIEVAFSPHRGVTEAVVKLIGQAGKTIRVAAYSFTSRDIAKALLDAHNRGVDVEVVLDRSNATARYSSATFLANDGIPTRIDYKYAIMHSKYLVVDGQTVECGSFNYTSAAEHKNAEALVIIHDPYVAQRFDANWSDLWAESEPFVNH